MTILTIIGIAILLTPAAALIASTVTEPEQSLRDAWPTLVLAGGLLALGLAAVRYLIGG